MNRIIFTHPSLASRTARVASAALCFLLVAHTAKAQLISGNAFLKGNYVEVGMAPYGIWGTTVDAPAGYHARSGMDDDFPRYLKLGFVADPDKDGWDVGTPNKYHGDYFLPALPYIGWGMQIGNVSFVADRTENGSIPSGLPFGFRPIPFGSILSVTTTATASQAVWESLINGIRVRKIVTVPTDKTYFTIRVVLNNISAAPINNIFYYEYINPDNDAVNQGIQPYGDVTNKNVIVYQNPADQKVLIKALGPIRQTYLGLGSKDCRAHVSRGYNNYPIPQTGAYDLYYGGTSETTISGQDNDYQNNYIDVDFKVGTIASGDSTAFTYAYILSEPDLDEALGRTDAQFETINGLYLSGDNIKACPGDRLPLSVTNAGDLSWAWAPNTNIDVTTGLHANIGVGNTPITYTATGTGVCGTKTIQLTITPDKPQPPTATANLYYCLNAAAQPLTATGTNLHWSTDPAATTGNPTAPTPPTDRAGTTAYFVRQTNTTGCISDATPINVLVRQPDQTTETIPVCAEKLPYTWNGISVPATGYDVATFKTTNRNGCDSTVTLNLLPNPVPSVTASKSNDIGCLNPTAKLNASAVVAGNTSGHTVFSWSPADGLSDPNSANPVASPAQTTTYQVTATNDGGCTATSSVTVNVSPSHSYTLPNAFTPNNDGHNDCFGFRNTAAGLKIELTVYDRLGRLVFHTTNPGDCWDGSFNGKPLPAGVYVYFVKGSGGCGLIDQKGTLTLVR